MLSALAFLVSGQEFLSEWRSVSHESRVLGVSNRPKYLATFRRTTKLCCMAGSTNTSRPSNSMETTKEIIGTPTENRDELDLETKPPFPQNEDVEIEVPTTDDAGHNNQRLNQQTAPCCHHYQLVQSIQHGNHSALWLGCIIVAVIIVMTIWKALQEEAEKKWIVPKVSIFLEIAWPWELGPELLPKNRVVL